MKRAVREERSIQRIIRMDPDKLPFFQKILWLIIVVIEWQIKKWEKEEDES
jgi:hypothetical protein